MNKSIGYLLIYVLLTTICVACSDSTQTSQLPKKASEALKFSKANKFNTDFCILIDMSMHSGKKRLFVYDFDTNTVVRSALCSHGCCNSDWGSDETKTKSAFSNIPKSHCSSLGKYKIGKRGYSNWGIHVNYKMHGLDKSNRKAYARQIVLHSWEKIPDKELYPEGTPEGWGCPAVSNNTMKHLDSILRKSKKPVLMWIFQ